MSEPGFLTITLIIRNDDTYRKKYGRVNQ